MTKPDLSRSVFSRGKISGKGGAAERYGCAKKFRGGEGRPATRDIVRMYIGNTSVCPDDRERKVFARVQTRRGARLRLSAAHKYARRVTHGRWQDRTCLSSTLRAQIFYAGKQHSVATDRIVSSRSLAVRRAHAERIFFLVPLRNPSNVKTVPHGAILRSGLGLPRVHLV